VVELRSARSRVDHRSEPVLGRSASETSSTGTRCEEEVGFSGIRIGDAQKELIKKGTALEGVNMDEN
jgi:hypothetical protein